MQYHIYRIYKASYAKRICWTYTKGDAKHQVNRLKKDSPNAIFEIRLSQ